MKKTFIVFVCGLFLLPISAFALAEMQSDSVASPVLYGDDGSIQIPRNERTVLNQIPRNERPLDITPLERPFEGASESGPIQILRNKKPVQQSGSRPFLNESPDRNERPFDIAPFERRPFEGATDDVLREELTRVYEQIKRLQEKAEEIKKQLSEVKNDERDEKICTREYAPVCGQSQPKIQCLSGDEACSQSAIMVLPRTYSNECEAKRNNVKILYKGECKRGDREIRDSIDKDGREDSILPNKQKYFPIELDRGENQEKMEERIRIRNDAAELDMNIKRLPLKDRFMEMDNVQREAPRTGRIKENIGKIDANVFSSDQVQVREKSAEANTRMKRFWNFFR